MSQSRPVFRVPWRIFNRSVAVAVGELVLLLAGIVALDIAWSAGRFWTAGFDPFLVPILLLSAQYGLGMGLTAVAASALVVLTGDLPPLSFERDLYSYWTELAVRPALWLAAALAIGSLSSRHIRRAEHLAAALATADRQQRSIAEAYGEASRTNEKLLLRLNSNRVTLPAVSHALQRLFAKSASEVLEQADELIALALDARSFSIFWAEGAALNLVRQKGWDSQQRYRQTYSADSLLFEAVIKERRLLCAANPLDEVFLTTDGVLAGPIGNPETGQVFGMLKVEELDFTRFHAEAIENFRIVAEWLGFALSRTGARRRDLHTLSANARPAISGADRAGTAAGATSSSAQTGGRYRALAIRLAPAHRIDTDVSATGEVLSRVIGLVSRAMEGVSESDQPGSEVYVVLPETSALTARWLADKLEPALQHRLPFAIQTFSIAIPEPALSDLGGAVYPLDAAQTLRATA